MAAGIAALSGLVLGLPAPARAAGGDAATSSPSASPLQSASPSPSAPPSTAPTAAGAGDPCGGDGRLLATLNRPTVGFSACAIPNGAAVLEEGYQNQSRGGPGGSVTTSYPQGFERFGLAERFELDIIGPNYNRQRAVSGGASAGWSDAGVGFKAEFPQRGRFTFALDGLFTAATGSGGFGAGGPSETLDGDVSYSVSPAVGVGTTLAVSSSAGKLCVGAAGRRQCPAGHGPLRIFPAVARCDRSDPARLPVLCRVRRPDEVRPRSGRARLHGLRRTKTAFELDAEYGREFTPVGGSRFSYIGLGAGVRLR